MNTRPLMSMQVKVARVLDVGAGQYDTRRIVPLEGGTFEGPPEGPVHLIEEILLGRGKSICSFSKSPQRRNVVSSSQADEIRCRATRVIGSCGEAAQLGTRPGLADFVHQREMGNTLFRRELR